MMEKASIFVLSRVAIYREGISTHIQRQPDLEVRGVAAALTSSQAEAAAQCDLCVVDQVGFEPAILGLFFVAMHRAATPVVVIGIEHDETEVLGCLRQGASGYVTKESSLSELCDVIRRTLKNGACVLDADIDAVVRRFRSQRGPRFDVADQRPFVALTERERQVVELLGESLSNQEIAVRLGISVHTAKHHVRRTLLKLGLSRRGEVGRLSGLVSQL